MKQSLPVYRVKDNNLAFHARTLPICCAKDKGTLPVYRVKGKIHVFGQLAQR